MFFSYLVHTRESQTQILDSGINKARQESEIQKLNNNWDEKNKSRTKKEEEQEKN